MTKRYTRISISSRVSIFDPGKWGNGHLSVAISSDFQLIAVRPSISNPSDEGHGRVYLYDKTGKELSSFDSHGGECGILFWPDDRHLLFGGYDSRSQKQKITVIQRDIHSGSLYLPLEHTALDGTSQYIIGGSKNGRYLAGWSSSPNSNTRCWYFDVARQTLTDRIELADNAIFSDNNQFAAFTHGHKYLPYGDVVCHLLNLATGKKLHTIEKAVRTPSQKQDVFLCFASDSSYCLFAHGAGIALRTLPDLQDIQIINLDTDAFSSGCTSTGNELLALGCINGDVYILSADNLRIVGRFISGSSPSPDVSVHHIQISKDNRFIGTVSQTGVDIYSLEFI